MEIILYNTREEIRLINGHPNRTIEVPRITQEFFPTITGPANQVFAISRGLEELGISSPILTTTLGSCKSLQDSGVTVHRFRPIFAVPQFRPSFAFLRYIEKIQASIFHIHSWRNPVSNGALMIARRRQIPVVVQAHGVAFGYRYSVDPLSIRVIRKIYDAWSRRIVTRIADVAVASTNLEAEELEAYGFKKSQIVVIPVGVRNTFFDTKPKSSQSKQGVLSLLSVGRLAQGRNFEQIIQAVAILRSRNIDIQLRVVGPEVRLSAGDLAGYRQHLEKLATDLGVGDIVTFTGPRYDTELLEEYLAADIFIYTSLYENFGQPIAEAAATGLPIVSTPTGVALDLIRNGESGFIVPFKNAEATASALYQLCTNPGLRLQFGHFAKKWAMEALNWNQIVPQYIDLYNSLN